MLGTDVVGRRESLARFLRLFSMGATLAYPLVGLASSGSFGFTAFVGCLVIGSCFHVYADVGNDVADLPIDATDPRRRRGPLVRGTVPPQAALLLALGQLPLLYGAVALLGGDRGAVAALSVAVVLIAGYDVFGKAIPVPGVADVLQGAGWSALVLLGAELAGGATTVTYLAMGFVTAYVAMVNGVHGALRDVRNDRMHGARTTAVLIGGDVVAGSVVAGRALAAYAALVHVALWSLLAAAAATGPFPPAGVVASVGLLAVATACGVVAHRRRSELRAAMAMATWHLALLPAALVALFVSAMPVWAAALTVAAYVAPPLLYDWAVRGLTFDLPSSTAARRDPEPAPAPSRPRFRTVIGMTRPGTWLSAGALTVIGAMMGDIRPLDAVVAAVVVAVIVAAGNVFNDRCDAAADGVNRPDRPLVTGALTAVTADRFVLAAGAVSLAAAALLGATSAWLAGVALVLAMAYSLVLRRWLLTGATTVALLFSSPILFGAAFAAGGAGLRTWLAAVLVFVFVLSREFLMGIPDVVGDRRSGYRTVAAVFGAQAAAAAFRLGIGTFLVVLWVPVLVGSAGAVYAAAVVVFACAPAVAGLRRLGREPTAASVAATLHLTGLMFGTGLVPLLAL